MKNMSLYDFPSFSDSLPLGPSVLVLGVISQINTLRVNLASSSALRGPRLQQGTLGCMEALGLCAKSNGKPLKSWKQVLHEVYILKRSGSVWRMGGVGENVTRVNTGRPFWKSYAGV